jgi:twinkle protein
MGDLVKAIEHRILNTEKYLGVQSQYFAFFNKYLKGLRKGELTIVTGASGSGKTTFLSQLSIDFLTQGMPTLWGSFEIKNEVLGQTMIQQFKREKLDDKNPDKVRRSLEEFKQYPLHFTNFYGSTDV